jgi:hypothetical protein
MGRRDREEIDGRPDAGLARSKLPPTGSVTRLMFDERQRVGEKVNAVSQICHLANKFALTAAFRCASAIAPEACRGFVL